MSKITPIKVETLMGHKVTNSELFKESILKDGRKALIASLPSGSFVVIGDGFKKVIRYDDLKTFSYNAEEGATKKFGKHTKDGIKYTTEKYIKYPQKAVKTVEGVKNFVSKFIPKKSSFREILESTKIPRGKWVIKEPK